MKSRGRERALANFGSLDSKIRYYPYPLLGWITSDSLETLQRLDRNNFSVEPAPVGADRVGRALSREVVEEATDRVPAPIYRIV